MKVTRRLAASVGAGVLAAASLGVIVSEQASAAPATSAAVQTVSAPSHHPDDNGNWGGRGSDGSGGEHSGGSGCNGKSHGGNATNTSGHGNSGHSGSGNSGNGSGTSGSGSSGGGWIGGGGGGGCHYPPSSTNQVDLNGKSGQYRGGMVSMKGKVTHNGCTVYRGKVGIYGSLDGKTGWKLLAVVTLDKNGKYRYQVQTHRAHFFQVVMPSRDGSAPSASAIVRL